MPDPTFYIERPPRLQPDIPSGEVEIPDPPQVEGRGGLALLQLMALPAISILGTLLVAVFGRGRGLVFMVPMVLSVAASIVLALYARQKATQAAAEQQAAYSRRLVELRKEMSAAQDIQRRALHHNAPGPRQALGVAAEAYRAATSGHAASPQGARLWERRPADPDFAVLRLGRGTLPSQVVYTFKGQDAPAGRLSRDAQRLAADSAHLKDVPLCIALRSAPPSDMTGKPAPDPHNGAAPVHALGVACSQPAAAYGFISALLVHYAAFHAPSDAGLYILGREEQRGSWRWAGRLPHCTGEALVFEDHQDRQGPKENNKAALFLRRLRSMLEERRSRLADENQPGTPLPHLLVVVDLLPGSGMAGGGLAASTPQAGPRESSLLDDLETDPGISLLMHEGDRLGASVIFMTDHTGRIPSGCQAVIELETGSSSPALEYAGSADYNGAAYNGPETGTIRFRYAEAGQQPIRLAGQADLLTDAQALATFAAHLNPLRVRRSYGADLPRSLDILEMLRAPGGEPARTTEELRQQLLANWQRSRQPEAAAWLQAAVGMLSGGDIRSLTFSSDGDGVHGLIAGSTGSGKSELLTTLILSLAYAYDPTIVNFVLVDFKGGAAFEPFRNLPHCVDLVTNLHGNGVERMFAAIMAEIHRREAINVATGSKHIVHYRKNGLHLAPYGQQVSVRGASLHTAPYPHLFVFIDEFAEMMAESPEYKAQLNSITRLGRALGIHLILAAQRPTGVTDQMRANIKFRIALRVETREESGEVLRHPDAAYLPTGTPGRGYLQVGNENIEMIQVAWSGADYLPDQPREKPAVIWHNRPANKRRLTAAGRAMMGEEAPKVFEMMVDLMAQLAREHSLPQRKPWPDFLPEKLSLESQVDTAHLSAEGLNLLLEGSNAGAGTTPTPAQPGSAAQEMSSVPLHPAVRRWLAGKGNWPGIDWQERAMRAVVGLVDNPTQAEQFPLAVNLSAGHAALFGASGWGKTTFLRSLLLALAVTHSPSELQVYILDFGGRQMGIFRDLPHVGAIILPDEEERVVRLLRRLDGMLEQRKGLLSDAGADDLYSYNLARRRQQPPQPVLPAVLVMIDNFAEFREGFDELMLMLTSLVRESRAYGIHFAVTADVPGALGGKLYGLFPTRYALKLTDPSEYLDIVGRGARQIEDIPGRGYVRAGRQALSFQAAQPVSENQAGNGGITSAADGGLAGLEGRKLSGLVSAMRRAAQALKTYQPPEPVNTLPLRVQLASLLIENTGNAGAERRSVPTDATTAAARPALRPILGIDDRSLEPWRFEARREGPHLLVLGPPGSGKTTTLRSLALSLAYSYSPEQVGLVLVDFQGRFFRYSGQRSLADLPHCLAALTQAGELEALVEQLKAEAPGLAQGQRAIVVLIDNYDTFVEEARDTRTALPLLGSLVRQYGTDGLHFVLAGSPDIYRSSDELRKQVSMPRLGIALASADLVSNLNGRVPRGMAGADLPPGRGFVVRGGQTYLVQLATPYGGAGSDGGAGTTGGAESSLDEWVERVQSRYPNNRPAGWSQPTPAAQPQQAGGVFPDSGDSAGAGMSQEMRLTSVDGHDGNGANRAAGTPATPAGQAAGLTAAAPRALDVETLKRKLLDTGLAQALLDLLSPEDMVRMAIEMNLLPEE